MLKSSYTYAQTSRHLKVFTSLSYSRITAKTLNNSFNALLLSKPQLFYGFDLQFGGFSKALYLKTEFLSYSYEDDPTNSLFSREGLKGNQAHYETGFWFRIFRGFGTRIGLTWADHIYINLRNNNFILDVEPSLGAKLELQIPLFVLKRHKHYVRRGAGLYLNLNIIKGLNLSEEDKIQNSIKINSELTYRKPMNRSFAFDFMLNYRKESYSTDLHDYNRIDIGGGIYLSILR